MQQTATIAAIATVLGGAYFMLQAMQRQGSGGGVITTDNTSEGSILDLNSVANMIAAQATPSPQENPTTLSADGIQALQKREGFSATPYSDHKGYSIGFGHLIKPGESLSYVSVGQATDLMMADVQWAQEAVFSAITVPISQGQFDALVSFCYNVGAGAFKGSTLVRKINSGDPTAPNEFGRWIYASGQQNGALIARRNSEQNQFESAQA